MTLPIISWRGYNFNSRTIHMIQAAESRLHETFQIFQGSYNAGGVDASAGTHDGGGAVDCWPVSGLGDVEQAVAALRAVGFAAWHRDPSQGDWGHHIHAIAIGDPDLSSGAAAQVTSYYNGGDGLAGNGPDYHPRPDPIPVWAGGGDTDIPPDTVASYGTLIGPGGTSAGEATAIDVLQISQNPGFVTEGANVGVYYTFAATQTGMIRIDTESSTLPDGTSVPPSEASFFGEPYSFIANVEDQVDTVRPVRRTSAFLAREGQALPTIAGDAQLVYVEEGHTYLITVTAVVSYNAENDSIVDGPINLNFRVSDYAEQRSPERSVVIEYEKTEDFNELPLDPEMVTYADPGVTVGFAGRSGAAGVTNPAADVPATGISFSDPFGLPNHDTHPDLPEDWQMNLMERPMSVPFFPYQGWSWSSRGRFSVWASLTGPSIDVIEQNIGPFSSWGFYGSATFLAVVGDSEPALIIEGGSLGDLVYMYRTPEDVVFGGGEYTYINTGLNIMGAGFLEYALDYRATGFDEENIDPITGYPIGTPGRPGPGIFRATIRSSAGALLFSHEVGIQEGFAPYYNSKFSAGAVSLNQYVEKENLDQTILVDDATVIYREKVPIPAMFWEPLAPLMPDESIDGGIKLQRRLFT